MTPELSALIATGVGTSITALGTIVVAFISNRGRQHAKAARDEVQNDHSTNLRVELDDRHDENVNRLQTIEDWQTTHQEEMTGKLRRIARLEVFMIPTFIAALLGAVLHIRRK